jgi:hypothetical protein
MKRVTFLVLLCVILCFAQIGRVSRAGYTTYDWLFSGPIHKWCITDTVANGIHISWTHSNFNPSTDLNAYYNYYDFATHIWNWSDGIGVFTQRSAFRSMDNNPITGCVYIMGNNTIARDQAPGAGLFEYSTVPSNLFYPVIAVTPDNVVHCIYKDNIDSDTLLYSRNWSSPININSPAPGPKYPSYNFTGSKISNKIIALWICDEDSIPTRLFYRISNSSGLTWQSPIELPYPPTTIDSPTFNEYSLYAMFDTQDNFHIVTAVCEQQYTIPAEIWHYCPINNPQWSLVFHYDADTLNAPVGYNASFACRPSIVQNHRDNYLYIAWEQFDSLNYEPISFVTRADVMIAESPNNGLVWQNQRPITTPNTTSKRFPCAGGVDHDTLTVAYLIDSIAGMEFYWQGRATNNPVVIQRIKVPLPGAGEQELITSRIINNKFNIYPNPAKTFFTIRIPQSADRSGIKIFDVTGKIVKEILRSAQNDNAVRVLLKGIKSGVYFVQCGAINKKITITK